MACCLQSFFQDVDNTDDNDQHMAYGSPRLVDAHIMQGEELHRFQNERQKKMAENEAKNEAKQVCDILYSCVHTVVPAKCTER